MTINETKGSTLCYINSNFRRANFRSGEGLGAKWCHHFIYVNYICVYYSKNIWHLKECFDRGREETRVPMLPVACPMKSRSVLRMSKAERFKESDHTVL